MPIEKAPKEGVSPSPDLKGIPRKLKFQENRPGSPPDYALEEGQSSSPNEVFGMPVGDPLDSMLPSPGLGTLKGLNAVAQLGAEYQQLEAAAATVAARDKDAIAQRKAAIASARPIPEQNKESSSMVVHEVPSDTSSYDDPNLGGGTVDGPPQDSSTAQKRPTVREEALAKAKLASAIKEEEACQDEARVIASAKENAVREEEKAEAAKEDAAKAEAAKEDAAREAAKAAGRAARTKRDADEATKKESEANEEARRLEAEIEAEIEAAERAVEEEERAAEEAEKARVNEIKEAQRAVEEAEKSAMETEKEKDRLMEKMMSEEKAVTGSLEDIRGSSPPDFLPNDNEQEAARAGEEAAAWLADLEAAAKVNELMCVTEVEGQERFEEAAEEEDSVIAWLEDDVCQDDAGVDTLPDASRQMEDGGMVVREPLTETEELRSSIKEAEVRQQGLGNLDLDLDLDLDLELRSSIKMAARKEAEVRQQTPGKRGEMGEEKPIAEAIPP